MTRYGFMIGTSGTSGMTNVESLPVPCMVGIWSYKSAQSERVRGDLTRQSYGPGEITWRQTVVNDEVRDQWRIFCPGDSSTVYIKSRVADDRNYHTFRAEMYWPLEEDHQAGRVLGLDFTFIIREEIV